MSDTLTWIVNTVRILVELPSVIVRYMRSDEGLLRYD